MKINKEYRMVLRAGQKLDKQVYRNEIDGGIIVSIVLGLLAVVMILGFFLTT